MTSGFSWAPIRVSRIRPTLVPWSHGRTQGRDPAGMPTMKESHMLDSAMDCLRRSVIPALKSDTHVTVFPDRAHFEAALRSILNHAHGPCAMLHVALVGDHAHTGSISRRMLNLVGSTLRACMRSGEAAYLGDAEFAVLLRGVDAREA